MGGFGNNANPIKNGICCDRCNKEFVIPARIHYPLMFDVRMCENGQWALFLKRRRSERRRTPSLKARELVANGWYSPGETTRETNDAYWVARYLCHNYKF